MLISLLVLAFEQIFVPIWVKDDILYRGPITLFEKFVVLIGTHKMLLLGGNLRFRCRRWGEQRTLFLIFNILSDGQPETNSRPS